MNFEVISLRQIWPGIRPPDNWQHATGMEKEKEQILNTAWMCTVEKLILNSQSGRHKPVSVVKRFRRLYFTQIYTEVSLSLTVRSFGT
jgi:hypothetical protein